MAFQETFETYITGSKDENPRERKDMQEAINNSKITAVEEDEFRELELSFTAPPKSYKSALEAPKEKLTSSLRQTKLSCKSSEGFTITTEDLLESSGPSLPIIHHKPIYLTSILMYPEFSQKTPSQQVGLLDRALMKIEKVTDGYARQLLKPAPLPKPIQASAKGRGNLAKNYSEEGPNEESSGGKLYVSRSGRQIKRKVVYTEADEEGDSDSDFVLSLKKNKVDDSDAKITLDNRYVPVEEKDVGTKGGKEGGRTPQRRFPSRTEIIMGQSAVETEKKKQGEKVMDDFTKKLSEDLDWPWHDSQEVEAVESDEDVTFRKKVIPPNPLKKGGAKKSNKKNTSKAPLPILKRTAKNHVEKAKSTVDDVIEVVQETVEKIPCPICNNMFRQDQIETHAASCGIDDPVAPRVQEFARSCVVCDQMFIVRADYEAHASNCVAYKI